jgi:hypothetical protein
MIESLRPLLHRFRQVLFMILGVDGQRLNVKLLEEPVSTLPVNQELWLRLADRISVMESNVTWRLYGLPATLGDLRLEHLSMMETSGPLEELLAAVARLEANGAEEAAVRAFLSGLSKGAAKDAAPAVAVGSLNLQQASYAKLLGASCTHVVADREDVFAPLWTAQAGLPDVVTTDALAFLRSRPARSLSAVWLSDAVFRSHTLKSLMLIQECRRILRPGGAVGGLSAPCSRVLPVNRFDFALLEAVGLKASAVTKADGGWRIEAT